MKKIFISLATVLLIGSGAMAQDKQAEKACCKKDGKACCKKEQAAKGKACCMQPTKTASLRAAAAAKAAKKEPAAQPTPAPAARKES